MNETLVELLRNINVHNESYFDNLPKNEKIDFSKTKKNWGTDIIPKEFWIDKSKHYETLNGLKVQIYDIVLGTDKEYTFPVKGAYLKNRTGKKDTWINAVWTLDGRMNLLFEDINQSLNLKEVK